MVTGRNALEAIHAAREQNHSVGSNKPRVSQVTPVRHGTSDKLYTVRLLVPSVILVLALGWALSGCAARTPSPAPVPPPAPDHSLTLTWNQSFANNPPCSTSVTTSCITGFVEGYLDTAGKQIQLHTDTAAVCAGSTQPETCTVTFNSTFAMGQITFYVATTFVDQAGSANVTAADTSTPVLVGADAPTSVKATVNS